MNEKKMIASKGEWVLCEVVKQSDNGWKSLHLMRLRAKCRKRSWWFAWNGERLSRTRDLGLLAEHHEDVLGWVYEVLDGGAA